MNANEAIKRATELLEAAGVDCVENGMDVTNDAMVSFKARLGAGEDLADWSADLPEALRDGESMLQWERVQESKGQPRFTLTVVDLGSVRVTSR